jgi:phosphinothricin acetyltransferase
VDFLVRPAWVDDADAIARIYNQGIEERQATFETRVHCADDFAGPLRESERRPFLVAEAGGRAVGWARVLAYSDKAYYAGVGEASVYVERAARRRGVGRRLLAELGAEAERRGYWKLVGLLFPENERSVALLRSEGYEEVGVYRRHGRMDGRWRDVLLVERRLGEAAR